jgi:hypothetical protein
MPGHVASGILAFRRRGDLIETHSIHARHAVVAAHGGQRRLQRYGNKHDTG